ncbi:DUF2079 domain-containing protein [Streptacidiphilus monticola]
MALRSPLVVVALPTLGWRFLSDNHDYWGTAWHYNAVLMPVLFLALVDALRRGEKSRLGWYRSYTQSAAVPLVTGVALALCVALPGLPIRSVFQPSSYRDTARSAMLDRALAGIPSGAAVESNVTPMAHLASRTDLYWLGGDHSAPDYVALDLSYGWSPAAPTDLPGYAQRLHPGTTYQVVFQEDQFVILRHVS